MDDIAIKSKPIKPKMLLSAMGPERCLILALSICCPLRKAASQTWEHISGKNRVSSPASSFFDLPQHAAAGK